MQNFTKAQNSRSSGVQRNSGFQEKSAKNAAMSAVREKNTPHIGEKTLEKGKPQNPQGPTYTYNTKKEKKPLNTLRKKKKNTG